jgi:phosphoribosylanthranilate isomerase
MSLFVKICGLRRPEDVEAVGALRPDAMGFIFHPRSPRYLPPERAAPVTALVPEGILKVGVFVDATPERVSEVRAAAGLDVVQLHGRERPADYAGRGLVLWKVVHLDRRDPDAEQGPVDALLIDRYTAEAPGGTGLTADWERARCFVNEHAARVLLAGGLTPGNVEEAVRKVSPWGVDVSSGVEAVPGRKDLDKVRTFIARCRNL